LECKLLPQKGYERLERYDWKLSRTVLRRGEVGNHFFLFGMRNRHVFVLLWKKEIVPLVGDVMGSMKTR